MTSTSSSTGSTRTRRAPRTASIVLFDGDDYERLSELKRAWQNAERDAAGTEVSVARGGDIDPVEEAHQAYVDFREEARERATEARVCGLRKADWRALRDRHPVREGDDTDRAVGYDRSTFPDAAVDACLVDPKFDTAGERQDFLDDLTEGETFTLFNLAYGLNEGAPADPKD